MPLPRSSRDVVADHATRKIDVAFVIDPGPPAQFGAVEVRGAERFEEELLRSRAGIPLGEPYSPDTLKAARKRLAKLDCVRGVRIIEGDAPDSAGRIPIIIDVTERKAHYIGANAAMSSVDGAEIGGYWGHRNVFGNGESLRLDATLSNLGSKTARDLEYEAKISLTRPSIASAHTDYGTSLSIQHEAPESYDSDKSTLSVGVTHQFSPDLTGKVAVASSWIATVDAFGSAEYFLLSLPGELVCDTRDNQLDPHSGWRAALTAEPATDIRNGTAFIRTRAQLSGYAEIAKSDGIVSPESASEGTGSQWSGPQGIVATGRIAAGTIAGADIQDVPVTSRFLAGGGGSVRGYTFRSIGPGFADEVTGGLSIVEASAELRIQVTETVGLVPFVDAAFVTGDSFFGGDSETALGVGFGLRYRTAIGPIRFDVATPLINKLAGDPEVVFYVGLGQAF